MKRILSIWLVLILAAFGETMRADSISPTDYNRYALDSIGRMIKQSENAPASKEKAHNFRNYAYTADKLGMTEEAQEYAQRAYDMYISLGEPSWASLCLYERCIAYHSIGDTLHMKVLLDELQSLAKQDTSALTQYNYYSILFAWYMSHEAREQAEEAGRRSIAYMEQIENLKAYDILPAWNYYNQALVYDLLYDSPQTDSIAHYLDLAEQSTRIEKEVDYQEVMISINDLRAWLYYYKKEYVRAERQMMQVLALIDTIAQVSPATVITERGEAYAFLVMLYQEQGRFSEALHYQQLLTENDQERYSIERQRVLDDVQTKYEVAQKELALEKERSRSRTLRLLLIIGVLVLVAVVAAMTAIWYRKKRTEEELYAKALEAENMHNELVKLRADNAVEPLEVLREGLLRQIDELPARTPFKTDARRRMQELNLSVFKQMIVDATELSVMDKRYLMCFAAGLSAEQTADIFCISPASVYTVRYRIKKKNGSIRGLF